MTPLVLSLALTSAPAQPPVFAPPVRVQPQIIAPVPVVRPVVVPVVTPVPIVRPVPIVAPVVPVIPAIPQPIVIPIQPVPQAVTLTDFSRFFAPTPGRHDVWIVHPVTRQPVKVCFTLPPGKLKELDVGSRSIRFEFRGGSEVRIDFRNNGTVRVDYDN
jgi:hypothetical protein